MPYLAGVFGIQHHDPDLRFKQHTLSCNPYSSITHLFLDYKSLLPPIVFLLPTLPLY